VTKNSHVNIALFSLTAQVVRVISGPLVLFFIANNLSSEEKVFYFAFFNLIALQQILEMGVGYTLKQFISHSTSDEKNNGSTRNYFLFTCIWFLFVGLVFSVLVGVGGYYFFSSYEGDVNWKGAWISIIAVSTISILLIPFQVLLEGRQLQVLVYRAKLIGTLFGTAVTIISLKLGLGLYSPSLGLITTSLIFFFSIFYSSIEQLRSLIYIEEFNFKLILKEVYPLLSKVSVTWILGYMLWNSFNLIAFKSLDIETTAKLGMTLALCKAGYSIADSIISSQLTLFGNGIAQGHVTKMYKLFSKYMLGSCCLLVIGFSLFSIIVFNLNIFSFSNNVLPLDQTIAVMIFSLLILLISTHNNFCRCFKVDPNFLNSIFLNLSIPTATYLSFVFLGGNFYPILLPALVSTIWSFINFRNTKRIYD
jgi:hypothetical protein